MTRNRTALVAIAIVTAAAAVADAALYNGHKVVAYTPAPMCSITIADSNGNETTIEVTYEQLEGIMPIPLGEPMSRYVDVGDWFGDNDTYDQGDYVTNRGVHPTQ